MRHFPLRELGYALGFLVVLAMLYVGAYYAMVERVIYNVPGYPEFEPRKNICIAYYRLDTVGWSCTYSEARLFQPIHALDRKFLRPAWWKAD